MPVKNWSDGDFVYGNDMDFIASSLVMRFADATARKNILVGDLAPTPGMMSFLADSQTWWQYVTVSGTGFWVPQPGTTVCSMYQATTGQTMAASTPTVVTLNTVVKNLTLGSADGTTSPPAPCWLSNQFKPKCPGWYLISGGVGFDPSTTGYRLCYLQKNSLATGALVPGSGNELQSGALSYSTSCSVRDVSVYLNGTTDFVELIAQTNPAVNLAAVLAIMPSFNAVYTGL
jgi:hypothetical protein